jgi:hypothetical protein
MKRGSCLIPSEQVEYTCVEYKVDKLCYHYQSEANEHATLATLKTTYSLHVMSKLCHVGNQPSEM